MTTDWLYPLSSVSGYKFKRIGGLTFDTGPASFQQMIKDGAIDKEWGVHKNWKNLEVEDRIFVYYGTADGDLGIVGLAFVKKVVPPSQPGSGGIIKLRWDRATTQKLLKHPLPAPQVRKHIPRPQGALWRIPTPLTRRIEKHLKMQPSATKQKPWKGKYATGVSSTISYVRPTTVTVWRRHDAILLPLKIRLESEGWVESRVDVQSKRVDLAMKKGGKTIIVEAKTVSKTTATEVRAAFAQLVEYGWRTERKARTAGSKPLLWALFEVEPTKEEIEFLEDQSIFVSWVSNRNKRIIHSEKTGQHAVIRSLG
jgi:hypothetical protein